MGLPARTGEVDNAADLLDHVSHRDGGLDAFVQADGERLTFSSWRAQADGVAAGLADHGVRPGDVVCLLLPSSIRYMICYQAVMRLGALTSGVNLRLGPDEMGHIFRLAQPTLTVVDGSAPGPPSGTWPTVSWSQLAEWSSEPLLRRPRLSAATRVMICWTSGTTGMPKGAVFDHANLKAVSEGCGILSRAADRRLSPLPFPHVGTMTRPWDEISNRITTVITPFEWSAAEALRLINDERVTVAQGVATQWELMLRHPALPVTDLSSLRIAGIGGSRIPPDLIARMRTTLGVPVIHRYASTESAVIAGTRLEDPDDVVCNSVGQPSPGVSVRVVDHHSDDVVPRGDVGRIQVRSGGVMRGYWTDPEATAAVLSSERWLTVGDEGWIDDQGNIHLVGRMGEMFIRGGYNIYPVEVERVIAERSDVDQVAVVGIPDAVLGQVGAACIVSDDPPDLRTLREWVASRLADYKAPDLLVVVPTLPQTALGKIDRRSLIDRVVGSTS